MHRDLIRIMYNVHVYFIRYWFTKNLEDVEDLLGRIRLACLYNSPMVLYPLSTQLLFTSTPDIYGVTR